MFVPDNYDSNISHALVVWLHLPGKKDDKDVDDFTDVWENFCADSHIIMVGPMSDNDSGWVPGDAGAIVEEVRDTLDRFSIDRQRIVAHGMGVGGQMALHLGFNNRDLFRGVATTGAVVSNPRENVNNQRLAFYLAGGELDPLLKNIAESKTKLIDLKYPVVFRQFAERGREYFTTAQLREVVQWIDSLDKQ